MTDKHPGLAIGGPLDGQLVDNPSMTFQVLVRQGPTFNIENEIIIVYNYVPTLGGVHFWIMEGETPHSVLTKLALAYMNGAVTRNGV